MPWVRIRVAVARKVKTNSMPRSVRIAELERERDEARAEVARLREDMTHALDVIGSELNGRGWAKSILRAALAREE